MILAHPFFGKLVIDIRANFVRVIKFSTDGVPVVIDALETVPRGFVRGLEWLEING